MSAIEDWDAQIKQLLQEAAAVARAGPTFEERWPTVEAELVAAEATFRRVGPQLSGFVSGLPEHVHQRYQATIGAVMVANGKALLDSERARVKAATQGGVSTADKARRLDELRRQILRTAAKRELAVREIEGTEFHVRTVHPELVVYKRAEVERIAAAR